MTALGPGTSWHRWPPPGAAGSGVYTPEYSLAFHILHSSVWFSFFLFPFPLHRCLSLTFCFTQISFFASLLPRLLRQAGRPTSLSSASVCSPADPGFLLAPSFGPGTYCAVCCTGAIRPV